MGKAKGFLTYDEVNDHMPENIVSSDQIDDWLSTLGGEGIEIVDASNQVKVEDKAPAAEAEAERRRRLNQRRAPRSRRKRKKTTAIPRPTTRCACTCARWGRSRC
jgi:hypothetical protein